tara:strand:- start:4181 stop:4477 length:297 start_codon:yes stop_codon:yes gene_type:complete
MNIYQLDEMILGLDKVTDRELIIFYTKKRAELVTQIGINVGINLEKLELLTKTNINIDRLKNTISKPYYNKAYIENCKTTLKMYEEQAEKLNKELNIS